MLELMLVQIVDFVIWSLFQRSSGISHRPSHVLCHGYRKAPLQASQDQRGTSSAAIPGVVNLYPNENTRKFKIKPWTEIISVLGRSGDAILRDLLLDCGVFVLIEQGKDNLHQVCGVPVSELLDHRKLAPQSSKLMRRSNSRNKERGSCDRRGPGSITFVRNRILYAQPTLNAQGSVQFGMSPVHVLNRHPDVTDLKQSVHVMKHIFPLQFGLHNVFLGAVDRGEAGHEFKDYTLREQEITYEEHRNAYKYGTNSRMKHTRIPKRLRGEPFSIVQRIRKRHANCSYTQLLRHHCPVRAIDPFTTSLPTAAESRTSPGHIKTQLSLQPTVSPVWQQEKGSSVPKTEISILAYATPTARVSAFCRAAVGRLLPKNALGVGANGEHNLVELLDRVDQFVRMRRYESFSLHEVLQNLRISCIPWLCSPAMSWKDKSAQTDRKKRLELLLELLYYIFDSILIPLIRSHFYVTESNVHRNLLFYFRHDVWRTVSEPSLTNLRFTMFQRLCASDLQQGRHSRLLGHSQVRLLPKEYGVRPIINLRRRMVKNRNGKAVSSQNVNSRLMPCFATLNYERSHQPQKLGSALFSVGEAHKRLREFRSVAAVRQQRLYFIKMDVKSCFDTIPQEEVVHMVQGLLSEPRYQLGKHAELKPINGRWSSYPSERPLVKFPHSARPTTTPPGLSDTILSHLAKKTNRTVFVDLWDSRIWDAKSLVKLLREHVQRNVVTMEKRFFRQRRGIPQGSVLSSLLCNFLYGEFENSCLSFLQPKESLLLRLIDDFLLITTNKDHAHRFAQVMVGGNQKYGIAVSPKKSLANFEISVNGLKIPRLHGSDIFPYCGVAINVGTLEVSKSRENKDARVSNGLTVELSRRQGLRFHRKVLDSLKIQMMAMLLDTELNSRYRVSSNLYQNFMEVAMKMYRYIGGLPKSKRPSQRMVVETWKDLINLAVKMTRGKLCSKTIDEYGCAISKTQMHWLAAAAFERVMRKKQTGYRIALHWVQEVMDRCRTGMKMERRELEELRAQGDRVFQRYRY